MAMPRKLKNLNAFVDGNSYAGLVKKFTTPVLARKLEAYRAGGMNGPVKADLGMSDDGMTATMVVGGLDLILLRQFGATKVDGVPIRLAQAYQRDDTGDVDAVEIVMRGRHESYDMGEGEPGADTEHTVTSALTYYKLTVNGEEIIEIDLLNMIERVNGVDLLEAQRQALGI